jgi:hypothetical protein
MSEVVHSVLCGNCQSLIATIINSEKTEGNEGSLSLNVDKGEPIPLVMRLRFNEHNYRFFCLKCAYPVNWNSGGRPFLEFAKELSIDVALSGNASDLGQWRLGRLTIPPAIAAIATENPIAQIRNCASSFQSSLAMVNAIADGTLLAIGLSVSTNIARQHIASLFITERHKFSRELGDSLESPYFKELAITLQTLDQLKKPLSPELWERMRLNGELVLDSWASRQPELVAGIRTVLLAQISLAWTAMEILSEDLWIAAVNERPNPLATNFAKTTQPKGQEKSITISQLAKYGEHTFDLSKLMGTLFAAEQKADFTSLASTNSAYEKAFCKSVTTLDGADLRLLELVRNLIVHGAGVVDDDFIERLKETGLKAHHLCVAVELDKPFPIDAAVVNQFAIASATAGADLLQSVVAFLSTN